jgi:predicted dehydrogenase
MNGVAESQVQRAELAETTLKKPRLGFLGVGWIGRNRMEAMAASGLGEIVAVADPAEANRLEAAKLAPQAEMVEGLDDLLKVGVDGVIIATPSALHAEQAIGSLEAGCAVFCQKPLARTHAETAAVIKAAKEANRLLGVDLSYRYIQGVNEMRRIIREGEIGNLFAADLVFHNAYGPDKSWFYDLALAGGGCVIDLGIHLVDLAFWILGNPAVQHISSALYAKGEALPHPPEVVEDYAAARMDLTSGTAINLACSWRLHAGCDASIKASFYGSKGGVERTNGEDGPEWNG